MSRTPSVTQLRTSGQATPVPITIIGSVPDLLATAGVDARHVALGAGLDPSRLGDPTYKVSFEQIGRFLNASVRLTGDELFGLRVGLAEGPGALDALGYLMMNNADVQGALGTLARYLHHFGGTLVLTREQGLALFEYAFVAPQIEGAGLIVEASMGLALSLLRGLCGKAWSPLQLQLARQLPDKPAQWQQAVHAPVYFGAERNVLIFAERWLQHRVERADPELQRILQDKVAELDAQQSADLVTRVCTLIRAGFFGGVVSQAQIAQRLALSPRTLKRRLQEQGTSHSELLERTRMETACHLLQNSRASMTQISELLGYANASAFTRAFSRCHGQAPRAWRVQQASSDC
jgi:AraC-like DNA-binding protein